MLEPSNHAHEPSLWKMSSPPRIVVSCVPLRVTRLRICIRISLIVSVGAFSALSISMISISERPFVSASSFSSPSSVPVAVSSRATGVMKSETSMSVPSSVPLFTSVSVPSIVLSAS